MKTELQLSDNTGETERKEERSLRPVHLPVSAGSKLKSAIGAIAVCMASTILLSGSDWSRFRGPNGTGVSPDRGLPPEVGRDKNIAWSAKTQKGNSSPIIAGGRLFLTAHEKDERIILCYDAATGKQLWRKSVTKARVEPFHPKNGPTTPTPTTDGQNIFVLFPDFGLLAYDRDGKELWRNPLGPFGSIQGMASSPVYVEGKVVLLVDTPDDAFLAAFDARTGKQAWRAQRPIGLLGSYATPTLYTPDGRQAQIVVAASVELTGYDAKTGERLWWARGVTAGPAAPPFVAGDSVYTVEPSEAGGPPFSNLLNQFDKDKNGRLDLAEAAKDPFWTGVLKAIDKNIGNGDKVITDEEYAKSFSTPGGGLIRTRIGGKGDVTDGNIVWRHTKGMPFMTGALLYENLLYVVRDGAVLTFDPESGKLLRQERLKDALGEYWASPVAGDGKIYLASLEGKVTVLKAGKDWQVLSTGDLGEEVIATPAISDGRVYIRTEGTLYCFGLAKK